VANSRRRERELARRRYERRRMRELELRARRRRRNTIIGATAGTLAVIAGVVALVIALVGGDDKVEPVAQPSAGVTPSASATQDSPCTDIPPAKDRPKIAKPSGKPPTKLVVTDVKKGTGPEAKAGDTLCVTYVGASYSTGKVFDASYKHGGQPFEVTPLGTASVIAGWNQGLIGVREGGVRKLVIPPDLGYGAQGSPPTIAPNETLVFLVTVEKVSS
jgi:FKBP-type peptidyl-prolyl cis-trans isomerase